MWWKYLLILRLPNGPKTQRLINQHWGLIAGILIYALVGLLYGVSLVYGKLSIANTIWQIMSIVIVFWIGVYMYNERPTLGQWIGVSVILVGMAFIMLAEKDIWTTVHLFGTSLGLHFQQMSKFLAFRERVRWDRCVEAFTSFPM